MKSKKINIYLLFDVFPESICIYEGVSVATMMDVLLCYTPNKMFYVVSVLND